MKRWTRLAVALLITGAVVAPSFVGQIAPRTLAQSELPPTIIVNTTLDDPRGCPERCTLRAAIAIASPGDAIGFDPAASGVLVLAQPLVIDKDLTINGPGADMFAIDGGERLRVLEIPAGVTVSISGLTIQNAGDRGIYNAGTLTVSDSMFSGNSVRGDGGAIYNEGTLVVANSTFFDNSAFSGGGIASYLGELTITDSTFSGNAASSDGGGVLNWGGRTTVTSTAFSGNSAANEGGGIRDLGDLTIIDSTFSGNSASRLGGGIASSGILTITSSTFSDNAANLNGGGIDNQKGPTTITSSTFSDNTAGGIGSGIANDGILTIANSTFSGNSAGSSGGGIANGGNLTITRSIFSGNSAEDGGGGIRSWDILIVTDSTFSGNSAGYQGGGIDNSDALTITNSTFSGNSAKYGGAISTGRRSTAITNSTLFGNSANIRGGGVFIGENGAIDLSNSIVAGNTAAEGPDIFGEVNSLSGNLVGDPQGAFGLWASDLLEGDLLLSPLADNGGPTWTIALQAGSPAVDAIPVEYCVWDDDGDPNTPPVPLLTDQRGAPRTGPCDIGAFEFGAVPEGG